MPPIHFRRSSVSCTRIARHMGPSTVTLCRHVLCKTLRPHVTVPFPDPLGPAPSWSTQLIAPSPPPADNIHKVIGTIPARYPTSDGFGRRPSPPPPWQRQTLLSTARQPAHRTWRFRDGFEPPVLRIRAVGCGPTQPAGS